MPKIFWWSLAYFSAAQIALAVVVHEKYTRRCTALSFNVPSRFTYPETTVWVEGGNVVALPRGKSLLENVHGERQDVSPPIFIAWPVRDLFRVVALDRATEVAPLAGAVWRTMCGGEIKQEGNMAGMSRLESAETF
ncbi:MAG: hypothetical protein KDB01_10210 [Planctomycetaceae bacterium]|nr:hypothetical protein [Planctomycetaceae bacterium]